jgi:hypothetical protein
METQNKPDVMNATAKEGADGAHNEAVIAGKTATNELLDLSFLFSEFWKKWWLVLIFILIGGYIGARDLHNFSGSYVAKMVVSPINTDSGGSSRANAGIVSVLAGLNLGGNEGVSKFDRLAYSISTIEFAQILDQKYQLMEKIFGSGLDKSTNIWIRPTGRRFNIQEKVKGYFNFPLWSSPTIEDLANFIAGSMEITNVKATPFKLITSTHKSPEQALEFLKLVYGEAELLIKGKEKKELAQQRSFLEESYSQASITDFRQALVGMMADQARKEMMSQGRLPSVARIVQPPYVSKYKTTPNVLRVFFLPIIGAIGLSAGLIILISLLRKE